jgi:hypothetical protein
MRILNDVNDPEVKLARASASKTAYRRISVFGGEGIQQSRDPD